MKVSKWGNRLAVRLPAKLVDETGLKPGEPLTVVETSKRAISVARVERRRRAIEELATLNWALPDEYKFDRDEVNAR